MKWTLFLIRVLVTFVFIAASVLGARALYERRSNTIVARLNLKTLPPYFWVLGRERENDKLILLSVADYSRALILDNTVEGLDAKRCLDLQRAQWPGTDILWELPPQRFTFDLGRMPSEKAIQAESNEMFGKPHVLSLASHEPNGGSLQCELSIALDGYLHTYSYEINDTEMLPKAYSRVSGTAMGIVMLFSALMTLLVLLVAYRFHCRFRPNRNH